MKHFRVMATSLVIAIAGMMFVSTASSQISIRAGAEQRSRHHFSSGSPYLNCASPPDTLLQRLIPSGTPVVSELLCVRCSIPSDHQAALRIRRQSRKVILDRKEHSDSIRIF
jgi:hypothetical protein